MAEVGRLVLMDSFYHPYCYRLSRVAITLRLLSRISIFPPLLLRVIFPWNSQCEVLSYACLGAFKSFKGLFILGCHAPQGLHDLLSVSMTSCWIPIFLPYYTTHWNSFCSSAKTNLFPPQEHYLLLFILPKNLACLVSSCHLGHISRQVLSDSTP